MKLKIVFVLSLCLCVAIVSSFAQKSKEKPNGEIAKMLKEVSAKRIETDIRKLVSFGTRNTLSKNQSRLISGAN
jgi:hypothetical protein